MPASYAIIIDSGSSGSRVHIYEYQIDDKSPHLLPTIHQVSSTKTKPGLSTFSKSTDDIWSKHFKSLIKHAEEIIPSELHHSTPIFIQATAGMRLIKPKYRKNILRKTCEIIKEKTSFFVSSCPDHVSVIDGDTEGLYGWLALNYLSGTLANKDTSSLGFMDMGGASTQLAFSPSSENDLEEHEDDMYKISLRTNNGDLIEWPVFVSSWLGFGANEARNRQLSSLLNVLPKGVNYDLDGDGKGDITDPCSPKGMAIEFEYDDETYSITGSGDYQTCLKTIYPLLLKNLKCAKEPCLFNGVHGPQMNWMAEKFVGVSEYWYTANDVFKLGGAYNYEKFETATQNFCSEDWNTLVLNYNNGMYGKELTMELLRASCFKASWIINVLHEGFNLPRLGVDSETEDSTLSPMFQSIKDVEQKELSWTLGKMIMYASSQVKNDNKVGITAGAAIKLAPEENIWKGEEASQKHKDSEEVDYAWFSSVLAILTLLIIAYYFIIKKYGGLKSFMRRIKQYKQISEDWIDLEEGIPMPAITKDKSKFDNITLRTRSTMNLQDISAQEDKNSKL